MKKNRKIILIVAVIIAVLGVWSLYSGERKKPIEASKHLDDTVITIDEHALTLAELMFYIAYEETSVQEQARVYAPDNPGSYWNLHIDGKFVKVVARETVIDMAVHDEIFYQLALTEGLELGAQEEKLVQSSADDFWSDLTEEEQEKMPVDQEVIQESIRKLTLAQKYQSMISEETGITYEAYDIAGEAYQAIRAEHDVHINDSVWNRLSFGDIIINKYE